VNRYWQNIEEFWREREEIILSAPRNEWAIGVYEWTDVIQMTPIEQALWGDIRELNAVFYPQWPVGGFFVDFANPVAKVALECDGAAWHKDKAKDATRDRKLAELGWEVYRFTGTECSRQRKEEFEEPRYRPLAIELLLPICEAHGLRRTKEAVEAWGLRTGIAA
jgi:hypothetical protein